MSLIIFLIAISTMIFVHELGHFLVAKWQGLKVEEFGFGFPPRIISKKVGETVYSLNLIPMGGFVRIWGMESKVKKDKKRAFYNQSKLVQLLILFAGVLMNFILAIGVFGVVYGIRGVPRQMNKVEIVHVIEDSPADQAGLNEDTFIVAIRKGEEEIVVKDNADFMAAIDQWLGEEVVLMDEDGEEYQMIPRQEPPEGEGALGVIISDRELRKTPLYSRIPEGIWLGIQDGIFWGWQIIQGIVIIISDLFRGIPPEDFAGPIGIYMVTGDIIQQGGLLAAIHFFAIVSVNLAVINIVPIPGTDGWHTCLIGFETIRGKELSQEKKRKMNQAAMIFILLLSALIIASDIRRFIL